MKYTWHHVAEKGPLRPSFHHSLAVVGDASGKSSKAYAVGRDQGESSVLEVFELDCKLERWNRLPSSYENKLAEDAVRVPRHGHVLAVVGGAIYVIGGTNSDAGYHAVKFDTMQQQWSVPSFLDGCPRHISSPSITVVGEKIVLFGGFVDNQPSNNVHVLDTDSGIWISPNMLGEPPAPRCDYSTILLSSERIVVHGESCNKDIWFLELCTQHKEQPVGAWSKYKPGTVPVVICGPSGVGKGTLITKLMEEFPDNFGFSVSHTTRKPREQETNGQHYHFTNHKAMERDIELGKFLEHASVHGNLYGTSISAVEDVADAGKCCILDIDVQGAQSVRKSSMPALFVFIAPPSFEELERRLRGRGTETEEQIMKRLETAKKELDLGLNGTLFDYVLVNDKLESALDQLKSILRLSKDASVNSASSKLVLMNRGAKIGHKLYMVDASTLIGGAPRETQGLKWTTVEPIDEQVPFEYANHVKLSDVEILMTGNQNKTIVLRLTK